MGGVLAVMGGSRGTTLHLGHRSKRWDRGPISRVLQCDSNVRSRAMMGEIALTVGIVGSLAIEGVLVRWVLGRLCRRRRSRPSVCPCHHHQCRCSNNRREDLRRKVEPLVWCSVRWEFQVRWWKVCWWCLVLVIGSYLTEGLLILLLLHHLFWLWGCMLSPWIVY